MRMQDKMTPSKIIKADFYIPGQETVNKKNF